MERTTVNRRYRVDRRIGEGGMAEVYLGHDLLLNRPVAIKAMRAQFAVDHVFRARFEREAVAVAGLTHPNIVEIFDVGEENGIPYLVMEYVRGDTLKIVIEQEGPFAPDDVAALLEQVGSGLDFAHERGIVHRDVKPQNILVTPDGVVKVVDFGIAKGIHDTHLTELGTGLGTVHYISPEQANGLLPTPASDVYSLGVVAFEMLTGRLPFLADSPVAVAMLHVHEPPRPPSAVFSAVPRQVDAIVLRALEKDPTRRYQSAGGFAAAMTDWRQHRVAVAYPGNHAPGQTPVPTATLPVARPTLPAEPIASPAPAPPTPPAAVPAQTGGARPAGKGAGASAQRDDVGCTTWLIGSFLLVALVALVWLGFRFSPQLAELGGSDDPTATLTGEREIAAAGATAAPSPSPAASTPAEVATAEAAPTSAAQGVTVPVPNLIGKTLAEATDLVTARGLLIEREDPVYSETVPADAVAEQDPPPDQIIAQGETIVIKLSRGSATISLEDLDLVGLVAAEAERRLAERGLDTTRVEIGDPEIASGRVVRVEPSVSAVVGETVTLFVSVGDRVQIPREILGRPVADVQRQLERLGLEIVEVEAIDREAIEARGVDLEAAGIEPGDVAGFEADSGADFDDWLPRGAEITLLYFEPLPENAALIEPGSRAALRLTAWRPGL